MNVNDFQILIRLARKGMGAMADTHNPADAKLCWDTIGRAQDEIAADMAMQRASEPEPHEPPA